jgi:hypothetical protein
MRYIEPNLEMLRLQRGEGYFLISQVLDIMVPLIDAVTFLHQQQPPNFPRQQPGGLKNGSARKALQKLQLCEIER